MTGPKSTCSVCLPSEDLNLGLPVLSSTLVVTTTTTEGPRHLGKMFLSGGSLSPITWDILGLSSMAPRPP